MKLVASQHNIRVLKGVPGVELATDESPSNLVAGAFDGLAPHRPTLRSKRPAYDHQRSALDKMRGKKAFGLFMEQGTGKTKTIMDWAIELWNTGQITGVLVVSKKGVHRQWVESELPANVDGPVTAAFWPVKQLFPVDGKLQWFAINYEGLKAAAGNAVAKEFAERHVGKLLMIADESQDIKNASSARHKAMTDIGRLASHRALATGTPIAKDLTDEWAQLKWLNPNIIGIHFKTTFQREFCIMGGFEGRAVVGHRDIDRFRKLTELHTFRATKAQIGILPKQYNVWKFDLTKEQLAMIKEVRSKLTAMPKHPKLADLEGAQALNKIRQISNGFLIDEDKFHHRLMPVDKNPRILAMLDWIDSDEDKAVVWAHYRYDMRLISEALTAAGITFVEYHGGVNDGDRAEAVKSFLSKDGARIFLANPQSAGVGLNLQGSCNRALYYSNSFSSIDRWQSEDRIHRIGTVGAVTYTDLVGKGSIDAYIARNLKAKKGLSDLVLDSIDQLFADDFDEPEKKVQFADDF